MASQARKAFDQNVKDVDRLMEIHADVGGDAQGRRFGLEVLNKSAIVLITAIWEAYCEDLAAEALEHLVTNVSSGSSLPTGLKKKIATDIKADQNDLAMWDLADAGWKARVKARLTSLMAERNRRLNTPKSGQIDELFAAAVGLSSVSNAWNWQKMSVAQARTKLDNFVELRGSIAHRGAGASGVKKADVVNYLSHVKSLVGKTGGRANTHVKKATGKALW
jgi:hypothetical protein